MLKQKYVQSIISELEFVLTLVISKTLRESKITNLFVLNLLSKKSKILSKYQRNSAIMIGKLIHDLFGYSLKYFKNCLYLHMVLLHKV